MDETRLRENEQNRNNPKIENLLNLALDATQAERDKSAELEVGFNPEEKVWELIVKYEGSLKEIEEQIEGVTIIYLMRGYAILYVPESEVRRIADFEEVTFIEKPKRLYFAVEAAKREACIASFSATAGSII